MSVGEESVKKENSGVFNNALGILIFGIVFVLIIFYFFPEWIVKIFSGKNISEASSVLFYLGIAFGFISLTNLILLYKLSINKVKGYLYLYSFVFVEVLLLSFFSDNLFEFSIAFVTASAAFLWGAVFLVRD